MTRHIEAVLLDLGNVVLEIDFTRVLRAWSEASGRPLDDLLARYRMDTAFEDFETGALTAAEYFAHVDRTLALGLPASVIEQGWQQIFVGPFAGVAARLPRLARHLPIACFTNTNEPHVGHWRARYADTLAPFHHMFVSSEIGRRKPAAESFAWVAERFGFAPHSILFLDDHAPNVEGARAAGLDARHVTSAADVEAALDEVLADRT